MFSSNLMNANEMPYIVESVISLEVLFLLHVFRLASRDMNLKTIYINLCDACK